MAHVLAAGASSGLAVLVRGARVRTLRAIAPNAPACAPQVVVLTPPAGPGRVCGGQGPTVGNPGRPLRACSAFSAAEILEWYRLRWR